MSNLLAKWLYKMTLQIHSTTVPKQPLFFTRLETIVSNAHQRNIPCCYEQRWEPYSPSPTSGRFIHLR